MRSGRGPHDDLCRFYTSTYPKPVARSFALTGSAETAGPWPRRRWPGRDDHGRRWAPRPTGGSGPAGTPWSSPPSWRRAPIPVGSRRRGRRGRRGRGRAAAAAVRTAARPRAALHGRRGGERPGHPERLLGRTHRVGARRRLTALTESLEWAEQERPDGSDDDLDLRYEWTAEAPADTAARLPEEITAPSPAAILRRAAIARWSTQALPVAAVACVVTVAVVAAQPGPVGTADRPAIYAQDGDDQDPRAQTIDPDPGDGPTATGAAAQHRLPAVRMRRWC